MALPHPRYVVLDTDYTLQQWRRRTRPIPACGMLDRLRQVRRPDADAPNVSVIDYSMRVGVRQSTEGVGALDNVGYLVRIRRIRGLCLFLGTLVIAVLIVLPVDLSAANREDEDLPAGDDELSQLNVDRLAAEFELRVEQGRDAAAALVFKRLKRTGTEAIPVELWLTHARVCDRLGILEEAIDSTEKYLSLAGRAGKGYSDALRLSVALRDKHEEAQRRDQIERHRKAEASRIREQRIRSAREQAQAARALPRDAMRSGGHAPEMVLLPGGRFCFLVLHNGKQRCRVVDIEAFAVSRTLVTVEEFARFVASTGYKTDAEQRPRFGCSQDSAAEIWVAHRAEPRNRLSWKNVDRSQSDNDPVVCVSVSDADAYTHWLSSQTGQSYRLPSATEWQFAFMAGTPVANDVSPNFRFVYDYLMTARDTPTVNLEGERSFDYFQRHFDTLLGPEFAGRPDYAACVASVNCHYSRGCPIRPIGRCPANLVGLIFDGYYEIVHTCVASERWGTGHRWAFQQDGKYHTASSCESVGVVRHADTYPGRLPVESSRRGDGKFDQNSWKSAGFRLVRTNSSRNVGQ